VDVGVVKLAAGGELRGRVTRADGTAVGFAQIEITPLPSGEARMEMAMNGSFRITGLAAGAYRVRAETPGGAPGDPSGSSSAPVPFELGKGERKSLDLQVK
jgi:Carboxypeptidase regulatory-like domain